MSRAAAQRRLDAFRDRFQRYGRVHLDLARHAAVPLALTPDLLYRLWSAFQRDAQGAPLQIPWIAVADLLLSNLCGEAGFELYELDRDVRALLLDELSADPRLGPARRDEVARFLLEYVRQLQHSPDPDALRFAEAQQWAALAYLQPGPTLQRLQQTLEDARRSGQAELFRVSALIEALEPPLLEQPGGAELLAQARERADEARRSPPRRAAQSSGPPAPSEAQPPTAQAEDSARQSGGPPALSEAPVEAADDWSAHLETRFVLARPDETLGQILARLPADRRERAGTYVVVPREDGRYLVARWYEVEQEETSKKVDRASTNAAYISIQSTIDFVIYLYGLEKTMDRHIDILNLGDFSRINSEFTLFYLKTGQEFHNYAYKEYSTFYNVAKINKNSIDLVMTISGMAYAVYNRIESRIIKNILFRSTEIYRAKRDINSIRVEMANLRILIESMNHNVNQEINDKTSMIMLDLLDSSFLTSILQTKEIYPAQAPNLLVKQQRKRLIMLESGVVRGLLTNDPPLPDDLGPDPFAPEEQPQVGAEQEPMPPVSLTEQTSGQSSQYLLDEQPFANTELEPQPPQQFGVEEVAPLGPPTTLDGLLTELRALQVELEAAGGQLGEAGDDAADSIGAALRALERANIPRAQSKLVEAMRSLRSLPRAATIAHTLTESLVNIQLTLDQLWSEGDSADHSEAE